MKPQHPHRTAAMLAAAVTTWMVLQTVSSSFAPPPVAGEPLPIAQQRAPGARAHGA